MSVKELWQVYCGQFLLRVSGAFRRGHPTVNRLECVCGGRGREVKIETLFVNRGVALPHGSLELSRDSTPLLAS